MNAENVWRPVTEPKEEVPFNPAAEVLDSNQPLSPNDALEHSSDLDGADKSTPGTRRLDRVVDTLWGAFAGIGIVQVEHMVVEAVSNRSMDRVTECAALAVGAMGGAVIAHITSHNQ
jgi:hypothetical protein